MGRGEGGNHHDAAEILNAAKKMMRRRVGEAGWWVVGKGRAVLNGICERSVRKCSALGNNSSQIMRFISWEH